MVNDDLELRRSQNLRQYAITQALARLDTEHPGARPEAIVVSVCAYEEEGNIAGVLEKMPTSINGEPYTVLVVVDGGEDRTAEIARAHQLSLLETLGVFEPAGLRRRIQPLTLP